MNVIGMIAVVAAAMFAIWAHNGASNDRATKEASIEYPLEIEVGEWIFVGKDDGKLSPYNYGSVHCYRYLGQDGDALRVADCSHGRGHVMYVHGDKFKDRFVVVEKGDNRILINPYNQNDIESDYKVSSASVDVYTWSGG